MSGMQRLAGILVSGCMLLPAAAADLDVAALIRKSVAATEKDWQAAPKYRFRERDIKAKGTVTYQVYVIEGSQYNKLVARNDQPLSPAEQQAENAKLAAEVEKRRNEPSAQRAKRVARYEREREDDHLMLREMAKAFTYKLNGETVMNGRPVYVLDATPNPDYHPPNARARVLTKMDGKLWIDREESQWVRVEARVTAPVSMYMVAKVAPGTRFLLEQVRVASNLWLPKHFQMQTKATVFGFSHNETDDEMYEDYEPGAAPPAALAITRKQ